MRLLWLLLLVGVLPAAAQTTSAPPDCVVLLHGMGRSASSMGPMARALRDAGYVVVNESYPSTSLPIDSLVTRVHAIVTDGCAPAQHPERRVHFVTHSLGGILVRAYVPRYPLPTLGRVVMLAPPNQGSEVAEALKDWKPYQWLNGPAGQQLGLTDSVPLALGPVAFEVGVIAGDRSLDPWFNGYFSGPHDGKVAVERTKVDGMADFLVVPHSHPFLMRADDVIEQTLHFLATGAFDHSHEDTSDEASTAHPTASP